MQDKRPFSEPENPEHQDDSRLRAASTWACDQLHLDRVELLPVSGDASFRRYFRLHTSAGPLILMDAPPQQENSKPFVDVAHRLRRADLRAPEILNFDFELGFGLIEDLGDQLYRDVLNLQSGKKRFSDLFHVLFRMANTVDPTGLPMYGHQALQTELDLFTDWYLTRHRGLTLTAMETEIWHALCEKLKQAAAGQPQVFVHRDFHSCNLLYQEGKKPGIIDFQDALLGPLSYDFVSLLWDRYIPWPRHQLEQWMESYRHLLGLDIDPARWRRWCDWMALQRNLKIVGIFARLHYRDQKAGYLEMIPVFYQYLLDVLPLYPEFGEFLTLLERPECAP